MATGEEHVAAAVEETPEKKEAGVTELPAPSGWTKKVRPRWPLGLAPSQFPLRPLCSPLASGSGVALPWAAGAC